MTQHTPGPWTYTRNPENTRWIIDAGVGYAIAVTAGFQPDNVANARLIAAAPDLASAIDHPLLRQLFGAIEDSGTPEAAKLWAICMAWFDVRDAAIAKIEGRS